MTFYTVTEIAEILKVTEDTVSTWIRKGRIGAVKVSGTKTVRVSQEDLDRFLNSNRVVAAENK